MDNTKKNVTLVENRVKDELRNLKGTGKNDKFCNEDLRALWHYENIKSVSKFLNNKPIYYERVNELINEIQKQTGVKVRFEYLTGVDAWRTEEDMLKYAQLEDQESFNICKAYIESLGYVLKPYISANISLTTLFDNWDFVSDYISKIDIDILKNKYDFSLNKIDFHKKYFSIWVDVNLKKPFDNSFDIVSVGKTKNNIPKKLSIHCGDDNNNLKVNYILITGFQLFYKNKQLKIISVAELQDFMNKLDKSTRMMIDNFL